MKRMNVAIALMMVLTALSPVAFAGKMESAHSLEAGARYAAGAGGFVQNGGQLSDPGVLFHSDNAYFTGDSAVFRVMGEYLPSGTDAPGTQSFHIYTVTLEGANDVVPAGKEETGERINFFRGNDPGRWASDLPEYCEIFYDNIYDGIDWVFHSTQLGLKYDFIVRPGADINDIRMRYVGAGVSVSGKDILIETSAGTVIDGGLVALQDGQPVPVTARANDGTVSFSASYDHGKTLVIDPLVYSTFLGGQGYEEGRSVTVDASGCAFIAGFTASNDFPTTPGAYDGTNAGGNFNGYDAYALKLNASGTGVVWSTYLGGTGDDEAYGIHLNSTGCPMIAGFTASNDFPTTAGAYDTTYNGGNYDAFVVRLSANGSLLNYSTYIGGSSSDRFFGIDIDNSDSVYLAGYTFSNNYPTTAGAFDTTYNGGGFNGYDGIVTKLNADLLTLNFSTYLGSPNADEYLYAVKVNSTNDTFVTGRCNWQNYPTTAGAFSTTYSGGNYDVVVTRISSTGASLLYSTYVGGGGDDVAYGLALDTSGNAYVGGYTTSNNFPTTAGAYDTTYNGGADDFVLRLNVTGNALYFSTYLGGGNNDQLRSVAVDDQNNSYVAGVTQSNDFPTTIAGEDRTFNGVGDAVLSRLNANGTRLTHSTYIGDSNDDQARALAVDASADAYVVGMTASATFPTVTGSYCTTYDGGFDAYALKLHFPAIPGAPQNLTATPGDAFILVNWSLPSDTGSLIIGNYSIYRGPDAGSLSAYTQSGNLTGYNDTNVTNGITYFYAVSAINILGEGPRAGPVNATAGTPPGRPQALVAASGYALVNLTWAAPLATGGFPVTGYSAYRGNNATSLSLLASPGNALTMTDTNVTNGQTYFYAVTASNSRGEGLPCAPAAATPGAAPTPPQLVKTELWGNHSVVQWQSPADDGGFAVTEYRLYSGVSDVSLSLLGNTTMKLFYDDTATAGNTYFYAVTAVNIRGESGRSAICSLSVGSAPGAPVLNATAGDTVINLTWTPGSDGGFAVTAFRVYRGDAHGSLAYIGGTSGTEPGYSDSSVNNGVTYYYAVSALNAVGAGPQSNVVPATPTGNGRLPGAPLYLQAAGGDRKITINWSAPSDNGGLPLAGYNVYKGELSGALSLSAFSPVQSLEDLAVTIGVTYYYQVAAVNARGEGPRSNVASAAPTGTGQLPGAPRNLTAGAGNRFVALNWLPPLDTGGMVITGYIIYRGEASSSLAKVADLTAPFYNDTAVTNGKTYYYAVSAVNGLGEGPRTNSVPATPAETAGGVPSAPQEVTAIAGSLSIVVRWKSPASDGKSPVTAYKVYRLEGANDVWQDTTVLLTYYDEAVQSGRTYEYRISALNARGEGVKSAPANATPASAPSAPSGLRLDRKSGTNVLTWSAPASNGGLAVTVYRVYRGLSGDSVSLLQEVSGTTFSDRISDKSVYYYTVTAVNARGEGAGALAVSPKAVLVQQQAKTDIWFPVALVLAILLLVTIVAAIAVSRKKPAPQPATSPATPRSRTPPNAALYGDVPEEKWTETSKPAESAPDKPADETPKPEEKTPQSPAGEPGKPEDQSPEGPARVVETPADEAPGQSAKTKEREEPGKPVEKAPEKPSDKDELSEILARLGDKDK